MISPQPRKSEYLGEGALMSRAQCFSFPQPQGVLLAPFPSHFSVSSAPVPVIVTPVSLSNLKNTWNRPTPLFPGVHTKCWEMGKRSISTRFAGYRHETWSRVSAWVYFQLLTSLLFTQKCFSVQTAALVLHDTCLVWDVFEGTSLQSYVLNSFPIHACLVPEACYHTPDGAK